MYVQEIQDNIYIIHNICRLCLKLQSEEPQFVVSRYYIEIFYIQNISYEYYLSRGTAEEH